MKYPSIQSIVTTAPNSGADQLLTLDAEGKPPSERLANANSAQLLWRELLRADSDSSWNRKIIDDMYDGSPPSDSAQLKNLGQGHRFNLNFGEAAAQEEAALTAYQDLTHSVPVLCQVKLDEKCCEDSERADHEQVIAEEMTRTLKNWDEFEFNVQLLAKYFIRHGVGLFYFPHEQDWRFRGTGLDEFKFPRRTRAHEASIEVGCCVRKYLVTELYEYIKDEPAASSHWNIEVVKDCILKSVKRRGAANVEQYKWEDFQKDVKNNDLYVGFAQSPEVHVVHWWVREFSGKVSHYLMDETGKAKDFLFKWKERFESMADAFVVFPYGVGNGGIHSIRGQGFKIFNQIQASNRLQNTMLDSTFLHCSLMVQTEDADDLVNLSLVSLGAVTALPPGLKIMETQFSNKSGDALGVVNHLSMQIQNNTGSYRSRATEGNGQERTATEVRAQLEQEAILSTGAMNLFYQPWGRLLNQVFKRLISKDYGPSDPGYDEAKLFRDRCAERGVPDAYLQKVIDITPMRAIGYGSSQMRLLAFDEMMQFVGSFDEVGRNNLMRDRIAQRVGYDQVDRYLPKLTPSGARPSIDEKFAGLENADMKAGIPIDVAVGDQHAIHARVHIAAMTEAAQMVITQALDPKMAIQYFEIGIPHTAQHLQQLVDDKLRSEQVGPMKKELNALNQLLFKLQKDHFDAQKAEREQQIAQGGSGVDPKQQKQMLDMQLAKQQADLNLQIKGQAAQQDMAIRDAKAAADIKRKEEKAQARIVKLPVRR